MLGCRKPTSDEVAVFFRRRHELERQFSRGLLSPEFLLDLFKELAAKDELEQRWADWQHQQLWRQVDQAMSADDQLRDGHLSLLELVKSNHGRVSATLAAGPLEAFENQGRWVHQHFLTTQPGFTSRLHDDAKARLGLMAAAERTAGIVEPTFTAYASSAKRGESETRLYEFCRAVWQAAEIISWFITSLEWRMEHMSFGSANA
jgi:hypothetical protein